MAIELRHPPLSLRMPGTIHVVMATETNAQALGAAPCGFHSGNIWRGLIHRRRRLCRLAAFSMLAARRSYFCAIFRS